jgi:hypothetical protein
MMRKHGGLGLVICALGLSPACGGSIAGNGAADGEGVQQACERYAKDTLTAGCQADPWVALPSMEMSRVQGRLAAECVAKIGLPGSAFTLSKVQACASALESSGCPAQPACAALVFDTGSLGLGASCVSNIQCASGHCTASVDESSGAGLCGVCAPLPAIGEMCAGLPAEMNIGACTPGATCDYTAASPTCVATATVASGGPCTAPGQWCAEGFYCGASGTCLSQLGPGEPCQADSQCTYPLICSTASGSSICGPAGHSGDPCAGSVDCAGGLVCDPDRQQCQPVTFGGPGEPCSETVLCMVGICGAFPSGTCPRVIADGEACAATDSNTTCDTDASCRGGTCMLGYPTCS